MALAAIVALIHLADARGAYEQAIGLDGDGHLVDNLIWGLVYSLFVALAMIVAGALLATKIQLPSAAAQMWSRIVAGVALLAVGCGMVGDPDAITGSSTGSPEATRLQANLIPGWYTTLTTLLALALLACLLAQVVLLFRPAAQDFYHLGDWEEVPAV